ncbi:MAG: toprim domain-containing protein, partial [Clostridia bacterium]|nr:toprim domain-containing protein [Clostridia bacterium]
MIKLRQALVVEGKYDKIKLGQIFDAVIVATEGFGLFNDTEKVEYLRMLARTCGIIVFTDPDGA